MFIEHLVRHEKLCLGAHSQSIAISDVESNGRPAIDERDTRSESTLHTSALEPGNITVMVACLHHCHRCQARN